MEHTRAAFKVNSARLASAVKRNPIGQVAPCRPANPNDQNSCKKFSQIAAFAQKIDGLTPKHTFLLSNK
jgi:hypothetical protein